jgi:hypothetical protein
MDSRQVMGSMSLPTDGQQSAHGAVRRELLRIAGAAVGGAILLLLVASAHWKTRSELHMTREALSHDHAALAGLAQAVARAESNLQRAVQLAMTTAPGESAEDMQVWLEADIEAAAAAAGFAEMVVRRGGTIDHQFGIVTVQMHLQAKAELASFISFLSAVEESAVHVWVDSIVVAVDEAEDTSHRVLAVEALLATVGMLDDSRLSNGGT